MTSQKARILLVDDHTLILQGIKHVVSGQRKNLRASLFRHKF